MRLTKRYIVETLDNIILSSPIRYERYYINDNLRIQKKGDKLEKEILDNENNIVEKMTISQNEYNLLKNKSYTKIIRDSYLYLNDERVSIKKYYDNYDGLIRIEVKFDSIKEMNTYQKELWMGKDITNTPLAFDKYLSKLTRDEFLLELKKYK